MTPSEPVGAAPQPASPPPSVATAAAPQIGGGGSAGTPPIDPGADVVRAFYGALARGDGALAATFLIPEKQKGGLAPQAMTSFYSRLSQPLQLTNVMPIDRTNYQATYSYRTTAMTCNNSVIVTLTQRGGRYLIQGIDARGGC